MVLSILISIFLNVEGAPILGNRADTPQNLAFPLQVKRTLFSIIWSCTSTVIFGSWTSAKPNILPPDKWKALQHRLLLMFWMIIAPEFVLAYAVRQYFAAREIRDTFNARYPDLPRWKKWTLEHGHFLEMGGFCIVDPDRRDAEPSEQNGVVLTFDYFEQHIMPSNNTPEIMITTADIENRSKGDELGIFISSFQVTWFIIQCIARGQQRLAISKVELVTLALASLHSATFAVWWHKPLGVQEPIRIYLKTEAQNVDNAIRQEEQNIHLSFGGMTSKGWKFIKKFTTSIFEFPQEDLETRNRGLLLARTLGSLQRFRYWLTSSVSGLVGNKLRQILSSNHHGFSEFFTKFLFGWLILLPSLFLFILLYILFLIPFITLLFLVSSIFNAVFGIVTTNTIRPGACNVPPFYAPTTRSDRWTRMVVFPIYGVIYGLLYCIGWNFEFPTHSERILWRATSLANVVIPLIISPIDFFLATHDINSYPKATRRLLLILDLVMTILLVFYVLARLSLVAQALASLRHQPQSALVTIDWTKYIPHIFS